MLQSFYYRAEIDLPKSLSRQKFLNSILKAPKQIMIWGASFDQNEDSNWVTITIYTELEENELLSLLRKTIHKTGAGVRTTDYLIPADNIGMLGHFGNA